jgi:type I restriction enzyme S subunit
MALATQKDRSDLRQYDAYKDSGSNELGQVPVHWQLRSLGSLTSALRLRGDLSLPLLSVVREQGVILRSAMSDEENHNLVPDDLSNYRVVRRGNLVVNKMKAWQGSLGIAPCDGLVSPAYFVFEIRMSNLRFAHLLLRSRMYASLLAQASDGVRIGQWDLSPDGFKRVPVALPPPAEQDAIVRFLDYTDRRIRRYIAAKKKLIALLDDEMQRVVYSAVTRGTDAKANFRPSGVEWLGDVPVHWEVAALRHRYSQTLGKMLDAKRNLNLHPMPYLGNASVQWDRIDTSNLPVMDISPEEYERYTLKFGDLIVCEGGEVGRAAIWSGREAIGFQKALHRLRPRSPERDTPRFLLYVLRAAAHAGAFSDGKKATFAHLTGDKLRAHRVPFPPKAEQDQVVDFLDESLKRINEASISARRHVALAREWRARLVSDVVTGRFDVREAAAELPNEASQDEASEEVEFPAEEEHVAEVSLDQDAAANAGA